MDGASLKRSLERLGLRQTDLARLVGVSQRAVSLWATDESPVPGAVSAYLRVLGKLPRAEVEAELAKTGRIEPMLENGMYHITFVGMQHPTAGLDSPDLGAGVLLMKDGHIYGADAGGVEYDGEYGFDSTRGKHIAELTLRVPPNRRLVTGAVTGPSGKRITIRAEFEKPAPASDFVVDVAGRPVGVHLTFMRRLPN
jgi:hypothetical protein